MTIKQSPEDIAACEKYFSAIDIESTGGISPDDIITYVKNADQKDVAELHKLLGFEEGTFDAEGILIYFLLILF